MGDEDLYVELIPNNMAVQQIIRNGKMITQSNLLSEKNGYLAILRRQLMEAYSRS